MHYILFHFVPRRAAWLPALAAMMLTALNTGAQDYRRVTEIAVEHGGDALLSPWAGGLNAAHLGMADLNNDGSDDLFVFDKDGKRKYAFIHLGGGEYVYEPVYARNFPPIKDWFVLADYNCDGITDLWTHGNTAAPQTWTGYYDDSNRLAFTYDYPIVFYESSSGFMLNLYTDPTHKPVLTDLNGDGDIDVLAFDFNLIRIDYYENQRIERGLACDSLLFERFDRCWGNFKESGITLDQILGDTCDFKFSRLAPDLQETAAHPGGTAIDIVDPDGDGVYDLLLGDLTFERLNYLSNNGTRTIANLYAQDDSFPSYDQLVYQAIFPAPYVLDIDQDGHKDIVVAPFLPGAIENYNNVWLYLNNGQATEPFRLERRDFLTGDMIDVGELAAPAFADVDGDGLQDIVIGTGGYYEGGGDYLQSLTYYRNSGTAQRPAFERMDRNFLDINALGFDDLSPAFGDLDGDGDPDLLIGERGGKILVLDNTGGTFANARFLTDHTGTDIDVGQSAKPALFDFDGDGDLDLMVGHRGGSVHFFENTGSASAPVFTFRTDNFGGVQAHPATSILRYSAPLPGDFDGDGQADLLLGGADPRLKFYSAIGTDYSAGFTETSDNFLNVAEFSFSGTDIRPRISPASADLSGEGNPEIVLGTGSGGLELYSRDLADTSALAVRDVSVNGLLGLYPNPAGDYTVVSWQRAFGASGAVTVEVTDLLGRIHYTRELYGTDHHRINLDGWHAGMYVVVMRQGNRSGAVRLLKR